jgi:hypothetical protein
VEAEGAGELGERIVVVVHPQIDASAPGFALGRDHQQRRRHPPAGVPAGGFPRLENGEQADGELALRRLEGLGHRLGYTLRRDHVRLTAAVGRGRLPT